jgi:hypothetical protein
MLPKNSTKHLLANLIRAEPKKLFNRHLQKIINYLRLGSLYHTAKNSIKTCPHLPPLIISIFFLKITFDDGGDNAYNHATPYPYPFPCLCHGMLGFQDCWNYTGADKSMSYVGYDLMTHHTSPGPIKTYQESDSENSIHYIDHRGYILGDKLGQEQEVG